MVAARVEVPESTVESRKNLILQLDDVDGPTFQISEH